MMNFYTFMVSRKLVFFSSWMATFITCLFKISHLTKSQLRWASWSLDEDGLQIPEFLNLSTSYNYLISVRGIISDKLGITLIFQDERAPVSCTP